MRTVVLVLLTALVLIGCGGDDGAAKKEKIKGLENELKILNKQLAELTASHVEIKTASYKAMAALKGAERSGDEERIAEAKADRDEKKAAADEALAAEAALQKQIQDLRDRIAKLKGEY